MKQLERLALEAVAYHISHPTVSTWVPLLPGGIKTDLLERSTEENTSFQTLKISMETALCGPTDRELCVSDTVAVELTAWVRQSATLPLRHSDVEFFVQISASRCRLSELVVVVSLTGAVEPYTDANSCFCSVSPKGLCALLGPQDRLEKLHLYWPCGFQSGVLTKIRSLRLREVYVQGDGFCRCVMDSPTYARVYGSTKFKHALEDPYLREFTVMAINCPNITHLTLDNINLDHHHCHSLLSQLKHSLQSLQVKMFGSYPFCSGKHSFHGPQMLDFFRLLNENCRCEKLIRLSIYLHSPEVVEDTGVADLSALPLKTLILDGLYFRGRMKLPQTIEKLHLSLEAATVDHVLDTTLAQLPNLLKLRVSFHDNAHDIVSFNEDLLWLSAYGSQLRQIHQLRLFTFDDGAKFLRLLCQTCDNLRSLDISDGYMAADYGHGRVVRDQHRFNGAELLELFESADRARKLKHLRLQFRSLDPWVLYAIAKNCSNLKTLDLARSPSVTDDFLAALAVTAGSALRVVDVSLCAGVTDDGVVAMALSCPNLQELSMFSTASTDLSLFALAGNCPQLKLVGISKENFSQSAIDYLKRSVIARLVI